MTKHYRDYRWEDGAPAGLQPVEEIAHLDSYKIVSDPYHKRISIEKYVKGKFTEVIYDSQMLDFRQLKTPEQTAWQKLPIEEDQEKTVCLIRDQNDRVLFIETHYFSGMLCRECRVTTPQGILLSTHRMFYSLLHDPFDGVVLYDANHHPVMLKKYTFDKETGEFTSLLEEVWKNLNGPVDLQQKTVV